MFIEIIGRNVGLLIKFCRFRRRILDIPAREVPALALTPSHAVSGRLLLRWGVYPFETASLSAVDELFTTSARLAKDLKLVRPHGLIVITAGIPLGEPGSTNMLKVQRVE